MSDEQETIFLDKEGTQPVYEITGFMLSEDGRKVTYTAKLKGTDEMDIALIADDTKKELMVQFCIAYSGILAKHNLLATGVTGKMVAEATGLKVHRFYAGAQGGDQQIGALVACNEIDMLLIFSDPLDPKEHEPNVNSLLRICDVHNVPAATNIATAEALIHSLDRGDLDWRDIVNPKH